MFGITGNAKNIKCSVKKGAFTGYVTDRPDSSAVVQYFTATPSGSPYHAAFRGFTYFWVYNPASGQNYFIQAYQTVIIYFLIPKALCFISNEKSRHNVFH